MIVLRYNHLSSFLEVFVILRCGYNSQLISIYDFRKLILGLKKSSWFPVVPLLRSVGHGDLADDCIRFLSRKLLISCGSDWVSICFQGWTISSLSGATRTWLFFGMVWGWWSAWRPIVNLGSLQPRLHLLKFDWVIFVCHRNHLWLPRAFRRFLSLSTTILRILAFRDRCLPLIFMTLVSWVWLLVPWIFSVTLRVLSPSWIYWGDLSSNLRRLN